MVFIKRSLQNCTVFKNQLLDSPQFAGWHAAIPRQCNMGLKPEFALSLWRAHMNVSRLLSFVGVEVEPK